MEKKLEKLEKEILELQEKVLEMEGKWKRALADYQNLERRTHEQRAELVNFANYKMALDLLGVLDCLEDAAKHIKDEGLDLSFKKFKETLSKNGVAEIDAEGNQFNPETMEAVDVQKGVENKVIKVNKKGYILNNRILRPAQVTVGRKE